MTNQELQGSLKTGYAEVNGLNMYYEIHGQGSPLVLIHGGGSTINTTFGRIIPLLAKHRQVMAVEMQAHGRTADRDQPLSFAQDADDVAALMTHLNISKADILGFSNGGQTCIEMALRHPNRVNKLILASAFYSREAAPPQFWEGFEGARLSHMPPSLSEGFLAVNNDPVALQKMFDRDVQRMKTFVGWTEEQIKSIAAPTLIINGNFDVGSLEHAVQMRRLIPNSTLVVFPGGHGEYLGTIESLPNGQWTAFNAYPLIEEFLN